MWLLGMCHKTSHILLKHKEKAGKSPRPKEVLWETEHGPVRAVLVPPNVFNLLLRIGVHHLEDLVAKDGDWANTRFGFKHSDYLITSSRVGTQPIGQRCVKCGTWRPHCGKQPRRNGRP